jgi:hypothetical protein
MLNDANLLSPRGLLQVNDCLEDLRKLAGLPPYDGGANPCRGDGYFAMSINQKYDSAVVHVATQKIVVEKQQWKATRQRYTEARRWPLTDIEEYNAVLAMQSHGGSFAVSIAKAWLLADLGNQAILREGFGSLLLHYHNNYCKGR